MGSVAELLAKRLVFGIATLWVISLLVFSAVNLLPGDLADAILGQGATPEAVAAFRAELGLDQPVASRYLNWVADILHGDLGRSLANDRPISELVAGRLANTVRLAILAAFIAIPAGVGLGILATVYRDRPFDRATTTASLIAISFPEFFTAYILVALFSVTLGWLPAVAIETRGGGWQQALREIALPALTLALAVVGYVLRMTRAAIVNVMAAPYIEMAQLKGASPLRIVTRHALPNALSPIINVVIINLAYLVVGVVVVEVVFVYPGLGQLLVDSVSKRDIPVVQACCIIFAATYVLLNLLADILSVLSNPRLRRPRQQV
ncbi:ABC transporter permease [Bosea sp. Tri-44]|uniref:ABC transporter permease n=1 Tax=Bosea sp. Tri-44 TaxID=1972137 RepID=UPI00100F61F1|nr:ABC transporter permease [Bosea sp. Tri-44]RXT56009.1 ABC transporter permease [Bosea sp. Tri-44]